MVWGHLAQQYAQIFGADTIAVDVTDDKLALARDLRARWAFNAVETDVVAEIERIDGADVAIVPAAESTVLERAHASEVFRLHVDGRTRVVSEIRKLDEINAAIDDVLAGRVTARVVLKP